MDVDVELSGGGLVEIGVDEVAVLAVHFGFGEGFQFVLDGVEYARNE